MDTVYFTDEINKSFTVFDIDQRVQITNNCITNNSKMSLDVYSTTKNNHSNNTKSPSFNEIPNSNESNELQGFDEDALPLPNILKVKCGIYNGSLYCEKFGSGTKGRSINYENLWMTPSEFEVFCGRKAAKDWQKSIYYNGKNLRKLIDDNLLNPHARSCSCSICCEDTSVDNPIIFYKEFKSSKKSNENIDHNFIKKEDIFSSHVSHYINDNEWQPKSDKNVLRNVSRNKRLIKTKQIHSLTPVKKERRSTSKGGNTGNKTNLKNEGNLENDHVSKAKELTNNPDLIDFDKFDSIDLESKFNIHSTPGASRNGFQTSMSSELNNNTIDNINHINILYWNTIEKEVDNISCQLTKIKELISQGKDQSKHVFDLMKKQADKEKNEAIRISKIQCQMMVNQAMKEEKNLREIAIQEALALARVEMQDIINSLRNKAS